MEVFQGRAKRKRDSAQPQVSLAEKIHTRKIILGTDTEFIKFIEFGVCPQNYVLR
jgi:hypothetical protein